MELIDLSPKVNSKTSVWPGDVQYALEPHWNMSQGDPINVATVTTTAHLGSHIDAPSHIIEGEADVAALPLEAGIGPCLVVDVSDMVDTSSEPHGSAPADKVIKRIEDQQVKAPIQRLLLRHYNSHPLGWTPNMPGLDPALVAWFGEQGGMFLGTDLNSFDPQVDQELLAHKAAIAAGVVIAEGLVLTAAPVGESELIALPLAWEGADASPIRAVLRVPGKTKN